MACLLVYSPPASLFEVLTHCPRGEELICDIFKDSGGQCCSACLLGRDGVDHVMDVSCWGDHQCSLGGWDSSLGVF